MILGTIFAVAFLVAVTLASRLFDPGQPARATPPGTPRRRPSAAPLRNPATRAVEVLPDLPVITDYSPLEDVLNVPVYPPRRLPPKGHWLFDSLTIEEIRGTTVIRVQDLPVIRIEGATDLAVGVRPEPGRDLFVDADGAPVEPETLDVILAIQPRPGSRPKHPRRM